jgi:hypothetical protein
MPRIWIGVHVHAEPQRLQATLASIHRATDHPAPPRRHRPVAFLWYVPSVVQPPVAPTEKSRIVATCQQASRSRAPRDQVFRLVPFGSGQNDAITFPRAGQPTPARPRQSNHELRVTRTPVHYLDKRGPP